MRKIFFVLLSVIAINCSNKEQDKKTAANQTKTETFTDNFYEIKNKSRVKSNTILSIADFTETDFPIALIFFKESERTFLSVKNQYFTVVWEYSLENDAISTDRVQLFKNTSEHIVLIPTYSEEFPTFEVVGINKNQKFINYGVHTYNYADVEKLGNTAFNQLRYHIVKHKNDIRIKAVAGKKEILLSDYSTRKINEEQITENEKNEVRRLRGEIEYKNNNYYLKSPIVANADWEYNSELKLTKSK